MVNDIVKYGTVQRGFLGVQFNDVSGRTDEEKKLMNIPLSADGIYITDVITTGGAYAAGLKKAT